MKYIPLDSFEAITSLLQAVEALGCLVTVRLEAYTCRHTREEKQIATHLAQYYANVQSTPPISPSPVMLGGGSTFGAEDLLDLPPPMVLGSAVTVPDTAAVGSMAMAGASTSSYAADPRLLTSSSTAEAGQGATAVCVNGGGTPVGVVRAQDIDERLVFLVAALNSLYEKDGYDFSVLTERDFLTHTAEWLQAEVDLVLQQLPESCAPAVQQFWPALQEQVGGTPQGCEVFEFNAPSCDPRADTSVFSKHYFLYNKSRKLLVSLLIYGEGNRYRGDDGFTPVNGELGFPNDNEDEAEDEDEDEDSRHYAASPELYHSPRDDSTEEEEEEYGGKSRDFYGY